MIESLALVATADSEPEREADAIVGIVVGVVIVRTVIGIRGVVRPIITTVMAAIIRTGVAIPSIPWSALRSSRPVSVSY